MLPSTTCDFTRRAERDLSAEVFQVVLNRIWHEQVLIGKIRGGPSIIGFQRSKLLEKVMNQLISAPEPMAPTEFKPVDFSICGR